PGEIVGAHVAQAVGHYRMVWLVNKGVQLVPVADGRGVAATVRVVGVGLDHAVRAVVDGLHVVGPVVLEPVGEAIGVGHGLEPAQLVVAVGHGDQAVGGFDAGQEGAGVGEGQ